MRWLSDFVRKFRSPAVKESAVETVVEPKELSRDDFHDFLEARVRATLDMSLSDFMTALAEGQLDPESPRVAGLAILLGARAR